MKDVFKKALPYLALSLLLACLAIVLPLNVGEGALPSPPWERLTGTRS